MVTCKVFSSHGGECMMYITAYVFWEEAFLLRLNGSCLCEERKKMPLFHKEERKKIPVFHEEAMYLVPGVCTTAVLYSVV